MRFVTKVAGSRIPDYSGGSLANLVAELELRLTGASLTCPLHAESAAEIPPSATYLLVLIDGLGSRQLPHPAARPLAEAQRATIHAPFPTTTTVSLATVATGVPPSRHGLIGHFLQLVDHPKPVNTLRWIDSAGRLIRPEDYNLLITPNLWERLRAAGIEAITVQPADFEGSPLTRTLYRGCRFEGVTTTEGWVYTSLGLAQVPGRLIFSYYPAVDIAAHMQGLESSAYSNAVADIANAWDRMANLLPRNVTMIGTADHGIVSIDARGKHRLHSNQTRGLHLYGDPRSLYVTGPDHLIEELVTRVPAEWRTWPDLQRLWGPGLKSSGAHGVTPFVKPDGVLLADRGRVLLPGHMDKRLIGYHGGLDPEEVEIPLLVASS